MDTSAISPSRSSEVALDTVTETDFTTHLIHINIGNIQFRHNIFASGPIFGGQHIDG